MTDTLYDADGNEVDQGGNPRMATLPRKAVRKLEKEAAEGREAKRQLEELQARAAFAEAGVPVNSPAADYFIRGYQGERTAEAIKAEWDKAFGSAQNGQQQEQQGSEHQQELDALHQGEQIAGGQGVPTNDKLAERDAKLAALSPTDPQYPQKFDAIFREYGGVLGSMVG